MRVYMADQVPNSTNNSFLSNADFQTYVFYSYPLIKFEHAIPTTGEMGRRQA
jgi:hypothetical protein